MASFDELTARVERLLLRFDELQRTNSLLEEKLNAATNERDSLRGRLIEARQRVDQLLSRIPDDAPSPKAAADATENSL